MVWFLYSALEKHLHKVAQLRHNIANRHYHTSHMNEYYNILWEWVSAGFIFYERNRSCQLAHFQPGGQWIQKLGCALVCVIKFQGVTLLVTDTDQSGHYYDDAIFRCHPHFTGHYTDQSGQMQFFCILQEMDPRMFLMHKLRTWACRNFTPVWSQIS